MHPLLKPIFLSIGLFAISLPLALQAEEVLSMPPTLDAKELGSLLPKMQQGGYVFYFRHASTRHDQEDMQPIDLSNCKAQRNLSDEGKKEAITIGQAFKRLRIPVGNVISSPYCRAVETAKLAFGHAETSDDLHFSIALPKAEVQQKATTLRQMLASKPKKGMNTIIVSHTANLQEAVGIWPKPEAVAILFKSDSVGNLMPIGRVPPEIWAQVSP